MANKKRLSYQDYRPLRRDEPGYSKSKRLLVSESTGDIISRRQFIKNATKTSTKQKETSSSSTSKPRKARVDKGMSRGDYKLYKAELEARARHDRIQRAKRRNVIDAVNRKSSAAITPDIGQERFQVAKQMYINNQNIIREQSGDELITEDDIGDEFYDLYHSAIDPDSADYIEAQMEFSDEDYTFDWPDGETP